MSASRKCRTPLRVRFNEVDSYDIVWHGHYVSYFEEGREGFGRQFGMGYTDLEARGVVVPIVDVSVRYRRPLRYGDVVTIITEFVPQAAAKIRYQYRITDLAERVTYCTGTTDQVMLDATTQELLPSRPEWLQIWQDQWAIHQD